MKYVEPILKYLSGELSGKEALKFKEDLSQNEELSGEFKQVKLIYDKLEEVLRVEKSDSDTKEKVIRDMLIAHDLNLYGGPPKERDEVVFMSKLNERIKKEKEKTVRNSRRIYEIPLFYISVAASIALMVMLMLFKPSPEKLYAKYYHPDTDEVLFHFIASTRGEAQIGISLYNRGLFKQSMDHFKPYIQQGDADPYIKLFYALACMEEKCTDDLSDILQPETDEVHNEIELARRWYYSLYLIHKGDTTQAEKQLKIILEVKGSYFKKAKRLMRKIN